MLRLLLILNALSLGLWASETPTWMLAQTKGDVSLLRDGDSASTQLGRPLLSGDTLRVGAPGMVVLIESSGTKLVLPNLSQAKWIRTEPISPRPIKESHKEALLNLEPTIELRQGALQTLGSEGGQHIKFAVPHGQIMSSDATWALFLRQDGSAILDCQKGPVMVDHRAGLSEHTSPTTLLIDQHGVRPYTKGSLPRPRAVFDFVDRPELLEETLDENKKRRDEDQQRKGEDDRDVKLRGKASSAELVEGEGNAEGEYRWDSGINPIFFILPLCIGIGIYYYKRKKQKEDEQTNSESGANQRDTGYESEDVQVWRGALTANDPPLVTVKKTIITGDVEDGASITAQHELVIKGSFQGAHLTSSHDVSVESGINGQNKARLEIQGKLTTSYISEAILVCGTQVEVQKAIRNATVLSEGDVRVLGKNILGGVVASHAVIQTPAIGSDFCETKILLGQPLAKQCELTEQETPAWASEGEWNKASSLKVEEEWVSALVEHGDAKLDQKKAMPGPVETKIDPSDLTKIQIRGYQP